ncbi:MAG: hypothetical protein ABL998_00810 [Planctomycetota bacterium]
MAHPRGERPLKVGDVVRHPDTGRTVRITDGQYWGEYGLSNFWYWQDAETGEPGNGYGWTVQWTVPT